MIEIQSAMKSSRLITMSKRRGLRWIDSTIDFSSTSDTDNDTTSTESEHDKTSNGNCCLICSILPALSTVNSCRKHLTLLTTTSPAQVICKMSSLQLKRKHRCHSQSKSRHWRGKRQITLESFNRTSTNDPLLSSNSESSTSTSNRSNHLSSTMKNNQNGHRTFSSPFVSKPKRKNIMPRRSTVPKKSTAQMTNVSTSTDHTDCESVLNCSARIPLKRVIHVKDEDEEIIIDHPQLILNMAQATQQMTAERNFQPKILLKRVCLE